MDGWMDRVTEGWMVQVYILCIYIYTRHICNKDKKNLMDRWVSALMDG